VKKVLMLQLTWLMAALAQAAYGNTSGLPDFTSLMESAGPAVVNIRVTQYGNRVRRDGGQAEGEEAPEIPEFFRRYFDLPEDRRFGRPDRSGAGSGFIYDANGYIITNHHVVEDADQIIVRLADRREFEADLVGSDEASDIALIKIDATDLPVLKFGESESLRPGEWVAAIGSPFNFDQSITAGIVSAKGRSNGSQQYVPFIQTDVAINRGNSGGPLLNMDGEVVGINSWILSSGGGYIGLSFSIPIEVAASTVKQLRDSGHVQRGLLGVIVGAVTRDLAEAMNLDRPVGALVNEVSDGGAAEKAGIRPGDIILEFDGQPVETWNDLPPLVGANPPGYEADVVVSRSGEKMTFGVVLDALTAGPEQAQAGDSGGGEGSNVLGLVVEPISAEEQRQTSGPQGGVRVTDVESDAAWRAGLRPGDVILAVNNRPVGDMDDFDDLVQDLDPDRSVALRVWRNGSTTFFAYRPQAGGGD